MIVGNDGGEGGRSVDVRNDDRWRRRNAPSLVNDASPGVAYDPVADRIVAWSGGSNVYALNMDTGRVEPSRQHPRAPPGSHPYKGIFGRWAYIPQYRVFALINSVDENAWVFRLSN